MFIASLPKMSTSSNSSSNNVSDATEIIGEKETKDAVVVETKDPVADKKKEAIVDVANHSNAPDIHHHRLFSSPTAVGRDQINLNKLK